MPNPSEIARQEELTSFEHENFSSRRTTGHNLYDPNATITQGELEAGFTPENSYRPVAKTWEQFVSTDKFEFCPPSIYLIGPGANLENLAPRVFKPGQDPNRTTKLSDFVERNTASENSVLSLESNAHNTDYLGSLGFGISHSPAILPCFLHVWTDNADRWFSREDAIRLRDWLTSHIDHANNTVTRLSTVTKGEK